MYEIRPRVIGVCAITVGDAEVTPAASHLFALLLTFALVPREQWTRRGLQDLLFADADERQASHRLRQLLYRLRGHGVVLQESSTGALRLMNPVGDPLVEADDAIFSPTVWNRAVTDPLALYTPRMPAPFLDWLEQRRDALRALLAARRVSQLRAARERLDWTVCVRLAESMRIEDPDSEDAAVALAEGYAMLGRREAALEAIDLFVREHGTSCDAWPALRRLRARVLAARIPRREGILRAREECLAVLADQWERAKRDAGGRLTVLFGPAGMGKTRVGETFAASVRLGGGQVLVHRCDAQSRDVPLALFTHLVPDLRRRRGSIGADPALSRTVDYLCSAEVPPIGDAVSPEARRDEVKRALVDLIESVSTEQPLLVLVDDAHLVDDASRAVLRGLVEGRNAAHVLVILLSRPRPDGHTLMSGAARFTSYILPALDEQQSRQLIAEIATHRDVRPAEIEWAVAQAAGNPFYLHSLALHPCDGVPLPAHVRSLAQSSYLGVSPEARTVFDACLLLHLHATPARVARVAGVSVSTLLIAARELEDADLLRFDEGVFVGPHAIMREALAELIPSTTQALLHHQIAELLTAECGDPERARVIAWPAVSSWLACGETAAGVALALQVARASAAMGEPEAGAVLLDQLPREALTLEQRRDVLDEIGVMADAGKCLPILVRALHERTQLAITLGASASEIASLKLRASMQEQISGKVPDGAALLEILHDPLVGAQEKVEAATRLLALADMRLDRLLAETTLAALQTYLVSPGVAETAYLRALLVYHTTFGDVNKARDLILQLDTLGSSTRIEHDTLRTFSYVVFGLLRLGLYAEAAEHASRYRNIPEVAEHLLVAEHLGCIAVEAQLSLGCVDSARVTYADMLSALRRRSSTDDSHSTAMHGAEVLLSIAERDLSRAAQLVDATRIARQSFHHAPRLRSAVLAHAVRIAQLSRNSATLESDIEELSQLFEIGKSCGAHDAIAEALWQAHVDRGEISKASALLRDYLSIRREIGKPEAQLLATTAADDFWQSEFAERHR